MSLFGHTTADIPVYDGDAGDITIEIEEGWGTVVRFTKDVGDHKFCFHISDPKAARKLRKFLKPLANKDK